MSTEDTPQIPVLFLREWRKTQGLSLESMVRRLETTRTTVGRWEQGSVSITVDQLVSYADALGVHPVDLFRSPSLDAGIVSNAAERLAAESHELEALKAERDRLAEKVAILSDTVAALGKVK